MASRTTTITSRVGLHARPAALLAQAATASGHAVSITVKGRSADAKSLLSVLGLAAAHGDEVVVEVTGPDDERVAGEIAALLETDHDAA